MASIPSFTRWRPKPATISADAIYDWLKAELIEMSIHYDDGNPMLVSQHIRLVLGNKLYVFEIISAERRDAGYDASTADLTLKLMTVEEVID